jgi:hypothetical protein
MPHSLLRGFALVYHQEFGRYQEFGQRSIQTNKDIVHLPESSCKGLAIATSPMGCRSSLRRIMKLRGSAPQKNAAFGPVVRVIPRLAPQHYLDLKQRRIFCHSDISVKC